MQIIKKIKIRNFRSFTGIKSEVLDLKDFNIFSWANDSWKSNIFRALNLFFNNEITHWVKFSMDRDFSEQKKEGIQRVIEIRLDFELTTEWTKYLSKNFAIEKKYYRDWSFDYGFIYINTNWEEIRISSNPENNKEIKNSLWDTIISSNPDRNNNIDDEKQYRKQFNEFLWKITFEYIPAVRETRYFSYLFWRVISKLREAEEERINKVEEFIKDLKEPKKSIKRKMNLIKIRKEKINWIKKKKWIEEYTDDYKDKLNKEIGNLEEEIENLKNALYVEDRLKDQEAYKNKISEFKNAIETLSKKINLLAWDLFQNISFIDNAEFTIADNLLDFFETFEIGTGVSKKISLKSRWDGMQSKFIPIILDFLSKVQREDEKWSFAREYQRNKYFLWGFEEPENSYEYSNAIRLSNNFVWIKNKIRNEEWEFMKDNKWKYLYEDIDYSDRKQIFITTHSEEFLRLFSEEKISNKVSLYLVKKEKDKSSSIKSIYKDDLDDVHSDLGLANIARSKLKFDIWQKLIENSYLKSQIEGMLKQLETIENSKKNILYVEDTYIDIYKIAYLKYKNIIFSFNNLENTFNKTANFDIFGAEWASNLGWFLNAKNIDIFKSKKLIWLFDFDEEWKSQFKYTLKKNNNWENISGSIEEWIFRKRKNHPCFFALLLPVPKRLQKIANINRASYVEIEHLLPEAFLLDNKFWKPTKVTGDTPCIEIIDDKKKSIWEKSMELSKEGFDDFVWLFEKIEEIFSNN